MKLLAALLALSVFASLVSASQWVLEVKEDKDHPDQCFESATNTYHALNSEWKNPGKCEGLQCSRGSPGTMTITGSSCPYPASTPTGCKLVGDLTKDFPDCCPKFKCDATVSEDDKNVPWIG